MNPMEQVQLLFTKALDEESHDPTTVALATASPDGKASVRYVLVKTITDQYVTFFTNYLSRKGKELTVNPHAAIAWYWPRMEVQVRLEGQILQAPSEESDAYFASRPRSSQIGAWASHQSQPLINPESLEQTVRELEKKFEGKSVPRPPHWGGFRLLPSQVEIWHGRPSRLHDRQIFSLSDGRWQQHWLQP